MFDIGTEGTFIKVSYFVFLIFLVWKTDGTPDIEFHNCKT
jgi:hypothetical protein